MKLKVFVISLDELQTYLDKYQGKIQFVFESYLGNPKKMMLIIDVS